MSRRCIAGFLTGAAFGVEGARVSRKSASSSIVSKELAGVPLLNYDLAYGGRAAQKYEKEHWVVVAKPGVSTAKLEELCASVKACEAVGHPSEGGVPYFELHSTEQELEQVLALAPGQMEFVEPDGMFSLDPEESVEAAASPSWGLDRVGSGYGDGGKGAHIYVLDTGIRWGHTDFGGRASAATDSTVGGWFGSGKFRECEGQDDCGGDVQGHGTHCAGTAGGSTFGIAQEALIYSCKVLSDRGSGSWGWTYETLDWLAKVGSGAKSKRPAVASMSLGGSGVLAAMRVAVDKAVDGGVMVVVAAGNSNADACSFSPAFIPSAVTVGSTDKPTAEGDKRSSFSNYGSCVEIWAPGRGITSAGVASDTAEKVLSGTSMACPHVSGAAALLLGKEKETSPADAIKTLVERAEKNAIKDLQSGDSNVFLWVGAGNAPSPAPATA